MKAGLQRRAPRRLRNAEAEARLFRGRALVGFAVVVLSLAGLAGWYFKLQVLDHDDYAKRSEANRIKPRPVVPGRGLILDREGRILADNVPAYRLDVVREDAGDLDEKVARLQLRKLNAQLTVLTEQQATYIGVPVAGPYKAEHYRY